MKCFIDNDECDINSNEDKCVLCKANSIIRMQSYWLPLKNDIKNDPSSRLDKLKEYYFLNQEVGQFIFYFVSNVEVLLRNKLNTILIKIYGDNWYNKNFNDSIDTDIDKIKKRISRNGNNIISTDIINSNSSFELWCKFYKFLCKNNKKYVPVNMKRVIGVPNDRTEQVINLDNLRKIRNRIAHHENIIKNIANLQDPMPKITYGYINLFFIVNKAIEMYGKLVSENYKNQLLKYLFLMNKEKIKVIYSKQEYFESLIESQKDTIYEKLIIQLLIDYERELKELIGN